MKDYPIKSVEYILFDLDGTLTDSGEGIKNSVLYALKKMGIELKSKEVLNSFIGPPLKDSFSRYFDLSEEKATRAVEYYREYYKVSGMYENSVYEGIDELLFVLTGKMKKLIVATSKAKIFAKQILEHFGIAKHFIYIAGSNLDGTMSKKGEVIAHILNACNISDRSKVLMIGDRDHDILGAKQNGICSIGVEYGYGTKEELSKAGASYIVKTVAELKDLLVEL